jgi:hypothetical protein
MICTHMILNDGRSFALPYLAWTRIIKHGEERPVEEDEIHNMIAQQRFTVGSCLKLPKCHLLLTPTVALQTIDCLLCIEDLGRTSS